MTDPVTLFIVTLKKQCGSTMPVFYLFIYSVIFLPFLSYNQSLESVGSMHLLQVLAFLVGFANYN